MWSVHDVWCGYVSEVCMMCGHDDNVSWWVVERLGWCRASSHVT